MPCGFNSVRSADSSSFTVSSCTTARINPTSKYSYDDKASDGPSNWGPTCENGRRQSPIDVLPIYSFDGNYSEPPIVDTRESVLKFEPKTHNFAFSCVSSFGNCGILHVDGDEYKLLQVHMHSPSEHVIASRKYPLELHFVHIDEKDRLAVVAVFFVVGMPSRALNILLDGALAKSQIVIPLNELQTASDSDLCVTDGSLTTPPCSEQVKWIFSMGTVEASLAQIGRFREMVGEKPNARPLQRLNGREVKCFSRNPPNAGIPGVVRVSSDVQFII